VKEKTMPHVIVKLWPGRSEHQKTELTEAIVTSIMDVLGDAEDSVSVAFEEISARHWAEKVYKPDILGQPGRLFKRPGYDLASLP
jgi:4-oxalocrotonate tautomerase